MTLRRIDHYIVAVPQDDAFTYEQFSEPSSEKLAWLLLRQLTDIPDRGMSPIPGTLQERRIAYQEFRNYVRQGITYWDAARSIVGSAAALPYYYSVMNLAKAELVRAHPSLIVGEKLTHGLVFKPSKSNSISGDYLQVAANGVFPLLYKHRTGTAIPAGTRLPIKNLLSLIPEIGLEVNVVGRTRPAATPGYQTLASNSESAWPLVMTYADTFADRREPGTRAFLRSFEEVPLIEMPNWRDIFAISRRAHGDGFAIFQARTTFAGEASGAIDGGMYAAATHLHDVMGEYISEPIGREGEFIFTPTLRKSHPLVLPLDLARYAAMYYLSSVVRYKPAALDPVSQGAQAWLMDSFTREVPSDLLANMVMGVRGTKILFNAASYRV
ncbi:YaaC family protein [Conyzicola sp.]|uniref:YaaC family protein n=1 Tax=Conyzicola sp. TaxID=1969404 RepID=UPI003988ACFF